jgi:hypothetical protein
VGLARLNFQYRAISDKTRLRERQRRCPLDTVLGGFRLKDTQAEKMKPTHQVDSQHDKTFVSLGDQGRYTFST